MKIQSPYVGLFLFSEGINMVIKHKLDEARDLLDKAQQDDDIFGKTARSATGVKSMAIIGQLGTTGFSSTWKRGWS